MDEKWYLKTKDMKEQECWNELYIQENGKQINNNSIWLPNDDINKYSGLTEKFLEIIFDDLNIQSVVDIGCSDAIWQSKMKWDKVKYLGIDIVKEIVEQNKLKYNHMRFEHKNLIEDECPKADMVIVRNVFLHTTFESIKKMLTNIKKSGSKYLLASTDINIKENIDTICIWVQRRNLDIEPFNLTNCISLFPEILPSVKKLNAPQNYLGLYYIDQIPDYEVNNDFNQEC